MTWFDIALRIVFGLIATGTLLVGAWIVAVFLVDWLRRTTPGAPVAKAPLSCGCDPDGATWCCMRCGASRCYTHRDTCLCDPVDAHADTVPIERATPWIGDRHIPWRASDEWLTGAVEAFDWASAERDVRKRVR